MSLLVNEFSQVLHRIVCFAPNERELQRLFNCFGDELSGSVSMGPDLDMVAQKLPGHSMLRYWLSFTLGKRGKLNDRVTLLGMVLDGDLPSDTFLDMADALILWSPGQLSESDVFFRIPFVKMSSNKPCIVGGLSDIEEGAKPSLRHLALAECFKRSFKRLRFEEKHETFLTSSLAWVLSFQ